MLSKKATEIPSGYGTYSGTPAESGIDTRFYTSIYNNGRSIWYFCFDYGWADYGNNKWGIMQRGEQALEPPVPDTPKKITPKIRFA